MLLLHMPSTAAAWLLPAAVPIGLWVAWNDMAFMKIPNRAVIALVMVFVCIGPLVLPLEEFAWRWMHLALVLIAGFLASTGGLMGAGDAKFAAAMAPFVAGGDIAFFCYLFAAVLLAAFVSHRTCRAFPTLRRMAPGWESWNRRDFPMGLALGGALILYLALAVAFGA